MRQIVLDTETTGLNPRAGDRLVEIGCVELFNHIPTGQTFHEYMNPERDMPIEAFNVHGLSEEFLSTKPLFAELVDRFLDFIGDSVLVIHNASFDIGFINMELERVKKPVITMDRVIDTLALARRKHPGAQNNLDALCRRYNIDNSAREKHGALLDSEILAQVYAELIGGRQANLLLLNANQNSGERRMSTKQKARPRPYELPNPLSEEEIEAHKEFVQGLGEAAVWNKYKYKT